MFVDQVHIFVKRHKFKKFNSKIGWKVTTKPIEYDLVVVCKLEDPISKKISFAPPTPQNIASLNRIYQNV